MPAWVPRCMYEGILGYWVRSLLSTKSFSHQSAMSGVKGSCLLCERTCLSVMSGLTTTGTFMYVPQGFFWATNGLVPVAAENSTISVHDVSVCQTSATCLVLSVPDGCGLAFAYQMLLSAEADGTGREGVCLLVCAWPTKLRLQGMIFGGSRPGRSSSTQCRSHFLNPPLSL